MQHAASSLFVTFPVSLMSQIKTMQRVACVAVRCIVLQCVVKRRGVLHLFAVFWQRRGHGVALVSRID